MKKKDLDYTKLVQLGDELVKVIDIGINGVTVETERGKRKYSSAGSLKSPIVDVTVPLKLEIERDESNWHVSCPQLRGFHTEGDTFDECLRNAKAAGKGFLCSIIKHYNEEHPQDIVIGEIKKRPDLIIEEVMPCDRT